MTELVALLSLCCRDFGKSRSVTRVSDVSALHGKTDNDVYKTPRSTNRIVAVCLVNFPPETSFLPKSKGTDPAPSLCFSSSTVYTSVETWPSLAHLCSFHLFHLPLYPDSAHIHKNPATTTRHNCHSDSPHLFVLFAQTHAHVAQIPVPAKYFTALSPFC